MAVITNTGLEASVIKQRNNLKSDRLDMTFGEIMHLYEDDNLSINPEFQRAFRWSLDQRTKFIESILIGIPIPPIFVAEDTDSRWELVDGLQRISSILSFFGELKNDIKGNNNYTLTDGNLIPELEGMRYQDLPIRFINTIKRAVCRVEILRWDSSIDMRYEVFARLNKSGSLLTAQELRNAIFRGADERVFRLISDLSKDDNFLRLMSPTQKQQDELFDQEMVLRYFFYQYTPTQAIKASNKFLSDQLDDFLKRVVKKEVPIDFEFAKDRFENDFLFLKANFGEDIFMKKSRFYPAIFDGLSYILSNYREMIESNLQISASFVKKLKEDEIFRKKRVSGQRVSPTLKYLDKKVKEVYGL